jgi:hypothetical protein
MAFPKDILILRIFPPDLSSGSLISQEARSQKIRIPGSDSLPLRTGNGRHPHRRGAGIPQHPAAGAGGGACGVHVIDQQNVLSSQSAGPGRKKSATQILPALVCSQARLTHRDSHPLEQTGFQMQRVLGMTAPHLRNSCPGQQLGMVEAPLALLDGVHGHRDYQHPPRPCRGASKSFQAIRQERTQPPGNWLHAVIFEQMNQRAKLTMVAAVGHRLDKSRRR